jgi:membrane protease subunit (stomatin/prohibitin family)
VSVSTFTVLAVLSPAAQAQADACQEVAVWGCAHCGLLNLLECEECARCGWVRAGQHWREGAK